MAGLTGMAFPPFDLRCSASPWCAVSSVPSNYAPAGWAKLPPPATPR